MAKLSQEDIVAKKMLELVKDITLDLDEVGNVIAHISPTVLQNRLQMIMEVAYDKKVELHNGILRNGFRD